MGSGLVAFRDAVAAATFATETGGTMVTIEDARSGEMQ
jgi:hypothetical protein